MAENPKVNNGIIATTVNAKAIAIGKNATASTSESAPELSSQIEHLKELIESLQNSKPAVHEAAIAQKLVNLAAKSNSSGDRKTLSESVQSVVSIFKAIGDTISTSQKIVDVAQGILNSM